MDSGLSLSMLQVNAAIRYASATSGRVVVATRELRRGDMIAAIPLQLMFSLQTHGGNDTYEVRWGESFVCEALALSECTLQ